MANNPFEDPNFGSSESYKSGGAGERKKRPEKQPKKQDNVFSDENYGKDPGLLRSLGDSAVSTAQGFVRGGEMVSNAFDASSDASKRFRDTDEWLGGFKSGGRRAEQDAHAENMRKAEESGSTWEEIKAGAGAFADAPIDTTLESLGTMAPAIAANVLTRGRAAGVVTPAIGGVQGAGAVKGEIYGAVKQKHLEDGATEEEAEARASKAQSYTEGNAEQIGAGAGLGVLASSVGVEPAAGRIAGRKIAGELAEDAGDGVIKSTAKGVAKEAPIETAQGGQERLAANIAEQNEGFDTPTWEGVAGGATLEGLAGGAAGGGFGMAEGFQTRRRIAEQEAAERGGQTPETDPGTDMGGDPGAEPQSFQQPQEAQQPQQSQQPVSSEPVFEPEPAAAQGMAPDPVPEQYRTEQAGVVAPRPSEQMGLNPDDGPISNAAAMAVDSGASEQAMIEQAAQEGEPVEPNLMPGEAIDPKTGEITQQEPEQAELNSRRLELEKGLEIIGRQARERGWNRMLMNQRQRVEQEMAQIDAQQAAVDPALEQGESVQPSQEAGQLSQEPAQSPQSAEIDRAASEAATSPTNAMPEPSEAQKEAGNYAKGHTRINGLDITIENPRGSERKGKRPDGSEWSHQMSDHYGYIKTTKGADGDHVDVYVGQNPEASRVFVIDQLNQETGEFDEHKVMMGYQNQQDAVVAYKGNFDPGWKVGPVRAMTTDEFKGWLDSGDTTAPVSSAPEVSAPVTASAEENTVVAETDTVDAEKEVTPEQPDIASITRKQIPDMSDAEVEAAIEHYGPDHKRTKKLKKEQTKRQKAQGASGDSQPDPETATVDEAINHRLNVAESEILEDIRQGVVPESAGSFAELQDHVDANMYVNDADREDRVFGSAGKRAGFGPQDFIDETNRMIEAIDAWLAGGRKGSVADHTPGRQTEPEPEADKPKNLKEGIEKARKKKQAEKAKGTAPEHQNVGVDDRELGQIVDEFNSYQKSMVEGDFKVHHLFDPPKKNEIVRLNDKVKVYHKDHGWMTPAEAKAQVAEWKEAAKKQGKENRSENANRIVLSLFDLTGSWSRPWEEAGYQVYRFDIQEEAINEMYGKEINTGDINNFSGEFFADLFGDFDGNDVYAVLAACPCTDFASSGARHFAAKDKDGRTVASVGLVHQTMATVEHFKPAVWAIENPVGRIEKLGGLPPWRLSFDPNHIGDPYTKKTLLWGRFNGDLPIAPVEPTEGSKMHKKYGGKSIATKNARSATPEGFAYGFFAANNAVDHPVMAVSNKFDRLDKGLMKQAIDSGMTEADITEVVEDHYYMDLDDEAAEKALRSAINEKSGKSEPVKPKNLKEGIEQTRKKKQAEKKSDKPRSISELSDAEYKKISESARYLKDFAFSAGEVPSIDKRGQARLSKELGKSGRDNLLMAAFNINRDAAHTINNRLDSRQPNRLRNQDMQEAYSEFPGLEEIVQEAVFGSGTGEVTGEVTGSDTVYLTEAEAKESTRLDRQKRKAMDRGDGDRVDELDEKQAALNKKIDDRVRKEKGENSPEKVTKLDKASDTVSDAKKKAALELKELLKSRSGTLNSGVDPEVMFAVAKVGALTVAEGTVKFSVWVRDVLRTTRSVDINDADVKPFLKESYGAIAANPEKYGVSDEIADTMDAPRDIRRADIESIIEAEPAEDYGNEQQDRPEVEGADTQGAQGADGAGERDGVSSQSGSTQADSGSVAAGQPGNVENADGGRPDQQAGRGSAGTNVDGDGRPDGTGVSGDGRKGAGRKKQSSDGAGERDSRTDERGSREPVDPAPKSPSAPEPSNFHYDNPLEIVGGGQVARFKKNQAAIERYNDIRDTGRPITKEDQRVLAAYTGWGSFGQELFQGSWDRPRPKDGWQERDQWLRDQLGRDEWEGMQRSIINAHYTDPPTVMAMWDMVKNMGFQGGRVLEPSMGIGNFFGMMPESLKSRSNLAGIELDPVTGGMAKMLYPDANVNVMGYEKSKTPDNFYDVVIGNWPFADIPVPDRKYQKLNPNLHDYFFLKALDQTRPGGLVVGITSHGSMDKKGKTIRNELARKGELVAAYRLPTGAFQEYAGTKVVTDIVILRKRPEALGMIPADAGWLESVPHKTPSGEEVFINEYFANNPDNVIGTIDFGSGTTTGRPGLIVSRPDNVAERLQEIARNVPEGAYLKDTGASEVTYVTNHLDDREGSLVRDKDGELGVVRGEYIAKAADIQKYAVKSEKVTQKREAELDSLIAMRRAYGELIDSERTGDEKETKAKRNELKKQYDAFVASHGRLNGSFGLKYMRRIDDPFYPAIAALERNKDGEYQPSDILTQSTTRNRKKISNPSASEAYIIARNQHINPTLEQIAETANKPEGEVRKELIEKGAIFDLPNGDIESADIYLSGNVRHKLREAKAALSEGNKAMQRNVDALERVKPKDIPNFNIEAQMGATWVSKEYYEQFVAEMLGLNSTNGIEATYRAGRWKISMDKAYGFNSRPEAKTGAGTEKYPFSRLVNAAISNQTVKIEGKNPDGSKYVNQAATEEVNGKIAEMRMKFSEWVWSDPERRDDLEREYNEVRNSYATPTFDGSFMTMEGMALSLGDGPFDLRKHQQDAIWRALVTRKSLNAHEVGTGKTFTMGGIAVESRRYGIAKKPLIMAHNANSKTVANEIQQMYPAAKVLYIDNLKASEIATRMRQIANDDWDAIVMPHSLINSIGFQEETLMQMAQQDIDELMEEAYEAAKEDGVDVTDDMLGDTEDAEKALGKLRSPTAKELVKARNNIVANITKQAQKSSKEGSIPFEELGIDMVLVDEVHEFKKPPIATKMRIKGMNTQSSDRSIALRFMLKYVRGMNNGGNVHTFSGTPITNSMTEAFHQMRYIMEEEMRDAGVDQWDGWFGSFAQEEMDIELTAAGEYESVTRLSKFINTPELRRMIGQYMDVVFSDDMPEMQPRKTKSGKTLSDPTLTETERAHLLNGRTEGAKDRPYKQVLNTTSDLTPDQKRHFDTIQDYAASFRNMTGLQRKKAMNRGDPESPIVYEGLAAKVSFDARLMRAEELAGMEGQVPDDPNSKASKVIDNVLEIYNSDERATQVVFTQLGLGKSATKTVTDNAGNKKKRRYKVFSTAHDIVERLVQKGIPREQIALVTGTTSKDKRAAIAEAMNRSEIRLVIGSTQSLGVGVNMQRNLRAMHHMDAPWMPGDLEQRNGRGQRQGNQWNTVREYRYLTDRIDGRRWQLLVKKQQFIEKFMKSDDSMRIIEADGAMDEDNDMLESFAEAAGDARILQMTKIEKKISMAQRRERLHSQGIANAKRQMRNLGSQIESDSEHVARHDEARTEERIATALSSNAGDNFSITIDGKTYSERGKAQEALGEYVSKNIRIGSQQREFASYGDLTLTIGMSQNAAEPQLYVKFADGLEDQSNKPTIAALEARLRGFSSRLDRTRERLSENRDSLERAEQISKEPFQQADELDKLQKQLEDIKTDLENNPVAPPAWLRTGAPVETEILWNGETFTVTGHRWNDKGWYVLAEDESGTAVIPYMEVKDSQGINLYEEREFAPPNVVEKKEDEAPAFSRNRSAADNTNTLSRDDVRAIVDDFLAQYPGASDVRTEIHQSSATLPGFRGDRDGGSSGATISGEYVSRDDTLHLVAGAFSGRGEVEAALREEILVHKGLGFFAPKDREQLYRDIQKAAQESRQVKALWDKTVREYEAVAQYANLNAEQTKRLYAEEMLGTLAQQRTPWVLTGWRRILQSIKQLMVKAGWLKPDAGMAKLQSRIDLMANAFQRGSRAPRRDFNSDVRGTTPGQADETPAFRRTESTEPAKPSSIPRGQASAAVGKKISRQLKGRLADLKPAGLGALPLMYLRDFAPKTMTALDQYMDQKRAMDADRNEMHSRYDALAQRWLKLRVGDGNLADKAMRATGLKAKKANDLDALMHDSTIRGIDPSRKRQEGADRAQYTALRKRYEAMTPDQQKLFNDVRDAYSDQITAMEDAIKANIEKSVAFAARRAQREMESEIKTARDEMTGEEQAWAIEQAIKRYKGRVKAANEGKASRAMALRKKFEQMRVDEPYFPLKRFGDYFVSLRDSEGNLESFSMFESAADMEAAAEQFKKKYPNLEVKVGRKSNKEDLREAIDPTFIADIQELIDEETGDTALTDAIYQMYLETLPDFSMRKSFIHRNKVPGYNQDAMRAFASSMFHSSHQIARLRHKLEMDELVEIAEEQAEDAEDSVDAMTISNELRKRHEWVMNPQGSKAAQRVTSAAFIYQLGITPAAAFVNTTQTFMIGIPVLGTRFKSERKASAELVKASKDFVIGKGNIDNKLTGDERAAFDEFMRMGLIDKTQAHDLAGVGDTGVEYSAVRQKVMGGISFLFHNAERYNREVTSIAAYRMARKSGMDHKAAVKEAAELTWTTHFDYSSGNRARYMQNDTAKILLVFRQYSINMLARLAIDARAMFAGESKQVKKEAFRRLAGMYGMFAVMAGMMGVPGAQAVLTVLEMLDWDDEDPWTMEDKIKRAVTEALGEDLSAAFFKGVPGTLADVDLTNRIGLGHLWFFSPYRELEGRDRYVYWMEQLLGAAPAMIANAFSGASIAAEGQVMRGVETALPKAGKDLLRSIRYSKEGVQSLNGYSVVDDVGSWGVISQAFGFTPAHVVEQYEKNSAIKGAEQRIKRERRAILNRYALAIRTNDNDMRSKLSDKIRDFNRRYPAVPITFKTISQSMQRRAQNRAKSKGGVLIDKRLNYLRSDL